MKAIIEETLESLRESGNLRAIPDDFSDSGRLDFSSNDYLGIASRTDWQREFLEGCADADKLILGASSSRLLASRQQAFSELEQTISEAYEHGRRALLFNSGYHANTGLIPALATKGSYILADKLVHASIIDGIKLSGAPFARFRHNDIGHLRRLAEKAVADGFRPMIVVESVYSMDGDSADIKALVELKESLPDAFLYVDEAHAVGVVGEHGLGLAARFGNRVDLIVGTLGKALASCGAYSVTSDMVRDYLVNRCRSLIFSTALPPISALWSRFCFSKAYGMDSERKHLEELGKRLAAGLGREQGSHIQAFIVGNPKAAVDFSSRLREEGFEVLPIRTPTVPPGTDRLRISLSAAMSTEDIDRLITSINRIKGNG